MSTVGPSRGLFDKIVYFFWTSRHLHISPIYTWGTHRNRPYTSVLLYVFTPFILKNLMFNYRCGNTAHNAIASTIQPNGMLISGCGFRRKQFYFIDSRRGAREDRFNTRRSKPQLKRSLCIASAEPFDVELTLYRGRRGVSIYLFVSRSADF